VAHVFVSYSRRDSAFVRRLADALQDRKEVWVDVEGIRDAEVFPDALRRAVEGSDAFVFVISPDAVHSEFCALEVEHATTLNKQIVPLALRPVADEDVPEAIRVRNWIPAGDEDDFERTVERLLTALDTDLEWEREHTRLTVRALEWDRAGHDRSSLLRGVELSAAERWLTAGADKDPGPTALEREYVATGRGAASRRQRAVAIVSLAVAVVSIALLVFALFSRSDAIHARDTARAQALTSDAERIGAQSLVEKNLDRALLLAVAGVRLQDRNATRGDLLALLQRNPAAIRLIRPSRNEIASLAIAPGRDLLATGDTAGVVRFEDARRWTPSGSSVQLTGTVAPRAMRFSPNGDTLAVVATQPAQTTLYAIDVASRRVRRLGSWPGLVPPKPAGAAQFAYSPDGTRIAVAVPTASPTSLTPVAEKLLVVDASSGRRIWQRTYPVRPGQWEAHVEFAADGTLLTSAQQGDTLLWNPQTGRVTRRFAIGGQPALSSDGRHVALALNSPSPATPSSALAILNLRTGAHRALPAQLPSSWITSLAFTPDRTSIVGASFDGDVRVWDAVTGTIAETYAGPAGARSEAVLDSAGRTVFAGSQDGSVLVSDLSGARRLGRAFRWNSPDQSCPAAPCYVVDPSGRLLATVQGNGSIALVDLRTLRLTATLPPRDGPVANAIAFSPNGHALLTGGVAGHLTEWSVAKHTVLRTIPIGEPVSWVAVSPNNRLIAVESQPEGSPNAHVELLAASSAQPLWRRVLTDGTGGLAFSPNGQEVAALGCCTSTSTATAWDVRTGTQLFAHRDPQHATAIAYVPDSSRLAVGTEDGQVLFWQSRDGRPSAIPLHVASGNVASLSFSADGARMAVSSFDLSTTLWDLQTRKQLGDSFPERPAAVPLSAFEPNGRLLIDYLSDASEWPTDTSSWMRFACQVAGRDLTPAEWHDVLPDRPYMHVCS
jgi:WD40 repeat protein